MSPRSECITNLRHLNDAILQWVLENKKQSNEVVNIPEVLGYLKESAMPVCPLGGKYTLGRVGEPPTCSIPGHSL